MISGLNITIYVPSLSKAIMRLLTPIILAAIPTHPSLWAVRVAELLERGCSALGEPCPNLPRCSASCPGRSRLREARRRHWRLPGLSSAPALPLHLGPRPPWGDLRGRGLAHCQGLSRESCVRGKGRASAGLLQRLFDRHDSAQHGVHQAPRAPGWGLQPRTPGG